MNTLNDKECAATSGGFDLVSVLAALIIVAGTNIINNWDSFKAGLAGDADPARSTAK